MKSAMTSSPLRVAIIGAGRGGIRFKFLRTTAPAMPELVAVCDSRFLCAGAGRKYECIRGDDPQAMLLAAVKPDVVSVCSL